MRHMIRLAVAVMVASLLTGVTVSAHDSELRVRRNQLVITSAMADCSDGKLVAMGMNFGSQRPHVTLALDGLGNVVLLNGGLEADLPDSFCDDPGPGTYLLTVMRPRMKHRRRWLKLTKKDLGTFDVAIGAATQAELADLQDGLTSHASDPSAHHDPYTNDDASAIAAGLIAALPHLSLGDVINGVAADLGTENSDTNTQVNALIDAAIDVHDANASAHPGLAGAGGGGINGYVVVERTVSGSVASTTFGGLFAGTLDVFVPCPVGAKPLGGGGRPSDVIAIRNLRLAASYADEGPNDAGVMVKGWRAQWRTIQNIGIAAATVIGQAICATVAP